MMEEQAGEEGAGIAPQASVASAAEESWISRLQEDIKSSVSAMVVDNTKKMEDIKEGFKRDVQSARDQNQGLIKDPS